MAWYPKVLQPGTAGVLGYLGVAAATVLCAESKGIFTVKCYFVFSTVVAHLGV